MRIMILFLSLEIWIYWNVNVHGGGVRFGQSCGGSGSGQGFEFFFPFLQLWAEDV